MRAKGGPVAQRLEQSAHNALVAGSNPAGPTNLPLRHKIKKRAKALHFYRKKYLGGGQHYCAIGPSDNGGGLAAKIKYNDMKWCTRLDSNQ
jgi:hypothetical protein